MRFLLLVMASAIFSFTSSAAPVPSISLFISEEDKTDPLITKKILPSHSSLHNTFEGVAVFFTIQNNIVNDTPTIFSVSPLAAGAGSHVTIKGNYFNSSPASNTVYFGAVAAPVISATDSTLQVVVPPGATQSAISVIANGLYACFRSSFYVTFNNSGHPIDATSFSMPYNYPAMYPRALNVKDFDVNGSPDFIYGEWMGGYSSKIMRNRSTEGYFLFDANRPTIPVASYNGAFNVIADFDGDGKEDHAALQQSFSDTLHNIVVTPNGSTPGTISFGTQQFLPGRSVSFNLIATDADRDGKSDLLLLHASSSTSPRYLLFYRNISSQGNIAFTAQSEMLMPDGSSFISTGDINGDSFQELAVSSTVDSTVIIFKNTSANGIIQYAQAGSIATGTTLANIFFDDMDKDGKNDIVIPSVTASSIEIFKNISSDNLIAFSPRFLVPLSNISSVSILADINGDAKTDIITAETNRNPAYIYIYENTGNNDLFSFAPAVKFRISHPAVSLAICDIDIDGKPDIITAVLEQGYNYGQLCLLRNKTGESITVALCPPSSGTSFSASTGNTYQWEINTGNGFSNLADNANYAGSNQQTLQLINISSSFNGYQYRCVIDGVAGKTYQLQFSNSWAGGSGLGFNSQWDQPSNWTCRSVPDENTDVIITSGIVTVNSNVVCNTLTVMPGASVTVSQGVALTVIH